MTDKTGIVRNPLTIIAIFAGLAETSGTIVLPMLDTHIQKTYVWFLMGFPALLVILFFIVLYLKREVLYAPSDFTNPDHFLKLVPPRARILSQGVVEEKIAISIGDIAMEASERIEESKNRNEETRQDTNIIIKREDSKEIRVSRIFSDKSRNFIALQALSEHLGVLVNGPAEAANSAGVFFDGVAFKNGKQYLATVIDLTIYEEYEDQIVENLFNFFSRVILVHNTFSKEQKIRNVICPMILIREYQLNMPDLEIEKLIKMWELPYPSYLFIFDDKADLLRSILIISYSTDEI